MRQDRAGTAGEHCRHALPVKAEYWMPDRVYAGMHSMKRPRGNSLPDASRRETELHELA